MKVKILIQLLALAASALAQPAITTQPISQTNYAGTTASFTVAATGTGLMSYQWQKYSTDFADLAEQTNTLLTLTNVHTNDAGDYRVIVTDTTGTTNSSTAHLDVLRPETLLISQPAPGLVTLTWSATNWVLVQSRSMSCAAWLRVPGNSPVTLPIRPGTMPFYSDTMFFRLAALPLVGPSQGDLYGCRLGCVTCCENYVAAYLLNPEQASFSDAAGAASVGVAMGSCTSAAQQEWLGELMMLWFGP